MAKTQHKKRLKSFVLLSTFRTFAPKIERTMEQKKDLQLFRMRSSRSAIADGFRLYMGHFRSLLRSSWIAAVVYALVFSAMSKAMINLSPAISVGLLLHQDPKTIGAQNSLHVWAMVASGLIYILVTAALTAYGFSAMSEHQQQGTISKPKHWYGQCNWPLVGRSLLLMVCLGLLFIGFELLAGLATFAAFKWLGVMAGIATLCLCLLLIGAFSLPLLYTSYIYMLTPKTHFFPTLVKTYGTGLRHWGSLFVVMLITTIVTQLLSFIIQLPAIILTMANTQSQTGALMGDPAGMPSYMGWLTVVVLCIAGFVLAYVVLSTMFPLYYLYGSIKTKEDERQQLNKTTI